MTGSPLRRGDVVRIRDERWRVTRQSPHPDVTIVEVRGCDRRNRGRRARFLLPFEPIETLPANAAPLIVGRRRWRRLARQTLAAATPTWDALRTLAHAKLDILPFQLEPALAFVRGMTSRVLLADAVGLGKTVQAGLAAAETFERWPHARALIVCPSGLRSQWAMELRERFGLDAWILDSASIALDHHAGYANPWAGRPLIIASIDYVKRPEVLRALEELVWDLAIFDEAHGLSGLSDRHAAACAIAGRARMVLLITATPHSGDDEAFARLCGIGDVDGRFPLAVLRRTRADTGLAARRRHVWLHVVPTPAERALHAALVKYARLVWRETGGEAGGARLAMIVLLRRAASSPAAAARSIARRLTLLGGPATPAPSQALLPLGDPSADEEPVGELAAPGLRDDTHELRILEELVTLAREATRGPSKIASLQRFLRRSRDAAIVFTEYRDTLDSLASALDDVTTVQLHGGLTRTDREAALSAFASGAARVLLATDAAGEGLNLHRRCRLAISLEVPWTPLRLEQRIGRVDRIGQRRTVHQVTLVAAGTTEQELVEPLVRRRGEHADAALASFEAPVDEHRIAAEMLGGAPIPPEHPSPIAAGLRALDLSDIAAIEAARARTARALGAAGIDAPERPFAAVLRGRPASTWVFRAAFGGVDQDLLWEVLLGICVPRGDAVRAPAEARAHVERVGGVLANAARAYLDANNPLQGLHEAVSAALERELAVAALIERRHARLAAGLVQGSLFDHRAEREAEAQRRHVAQALNQTRAHVAALHRRLHTPAPVSVELAFAGLSR